MEGWLLFYCKGPNGEYLEFNQVTRKVKGSFAKAQEEYNIANQTSFGVSDVKIQSLNSKEEKDMSERVEPSEQLKAVGELSQFIMAQDWEKVKNYLSDDIFYKVGFGEPVRVPQAVIDFFKQTFRNTAIFYGHDARKIWQEADIITIEMDAKYELVGSKKHVTIACCDLYRMQGNKVNEWRVYADMSPWQN